MKLPVSRVIYGALAVIAGCAMPFGLLLADVFTPKIGVFPAIVVGLIPVIITIVCVNLALRVEERMIDEADTREREERWADYASALEAKLVNR